MPSELETRLRHELDELGVEIIEDLDTPGGVQVTAKRPPNKASGTFLASGWNICEALRNTIERVPELPGPPIG